MSRLVQQKGETSKLAYVSGVHCSEGVLRKFTQGSPLANGKIFMDGHVLIMLMMSSMTNMSVQVTDGDSQVLVLGKSQHKKVAVQSDTQVSSAQEHQGVNQGCVESLSSSEGWMASPVRSNIGTKVFKDFDSMLNAHEWNQKIKEEINLEKDVQVSVQALEQLGSQLKTIDEGDGNSEWQWVVTYPS
ncbi:hypothetical protein F2Q70_00027556 [Brassica cretica]|uniref:Uncharacterized protein n=1 Tax=Brassica cretica TaxID=69181 RepID=A0A8S9L002_BRACR|nr:hypothetical protein F2Q70_00027556 [Brassica cretica]